MTISNTSKCQIGTTKTAPKTHLTNKANKQQIRTPPKKYKQKSRVLPPSICKLNENYLIVISSYSMLPSPIRSECSIVTFQFVFGFAARKRSS